MESIYILIIMGGAAAGFVQGLSGFAFGMTAMSFWAWGMDPVIAASLAVFGALTGQIIAAFTVKRGFDWRLLLPFFIGGMVGIPIGVMLLPLLNMDMFKALLGSILIIWCPSMLFVTRFPKITSKGRVADGAIGLIGGVMSGFGGFAGIVPTLWCTLQGMAKDKQRVIIQNFNLGALIFTMIAYLYKGIITASMLPYFAVLVPAMLIPSILGTKLYHRISDVAFRRLVLSLLTLSGIALLSSSLPKLL
ncbi:MAG: sulfite exporter TauE/SafE family protein [Pseudomonadota bacterium]